MRGLAACFLVLVSLAMGLASCGSSEVACSDVCSCRGLSGQSSCLSECQASHDEERESAGRAGCATEYAALQACLADNAICDSKRKELVVPVSACGADVTHLLDCEFPVVPTGVGGAGSSSSASSSTTSSSTTSSSTASSSSTGTSSASTSASASSASGSSSSGSGS